MHTLAARTYVNSDSTKVVPEGSIDAAYLLGIAGDEISDETAARLGLDQAPATSYADHKVAELRVLLEDRGLDSAGTKPDLIARLEADDAFAAEDDGVKQQNAPG